MKQHISISDNNFPNWCCFYLEFLDSSSNYFPFIFRLHQSGAGGGGTDSDTGPMAGWWCLIFIMVSSICKLVLIPNYMGGVQNFRFFSIFLFGIGAKFSVFQLVLTDFALTFCGWGNPEMSIGVISLHCHWWNWRTWHSSLFSQTDRWMDGWMDSIRPLIHRT